MMVVVVTVLARIYLKGRWSSSQSCAFQMLFSSQRQIFSYNFHLNLSELTINLTLGSFHPSLSSSSFSSCYFHLLPVLVFELSIGFQFYP
jgi:hypothetical protein